MQKCKRELSLHSITLPRHCGSLVQAASAGELRLARQLLDWLQSHWNMWAVSLLDIYQRGPSAIRDKARASRMVSILEDHGYLDRIESGAEIEGKWRREHGA